MLTLPSKVHLVLLAERKPLCSICRVFLLHLPVALTQEQPSADVHAQICDYGLLWVGRDLKDHPVPPPIPGECACASQLLSCTNMWSVADNSAREVWKTESAKK